MKAISANAFKLKKEKVEVWRDWCSTLNTTYKQEAERTLIEEGLEDEFCGIFFDSNTWYAVIVEIGDGGGYVNKENPLNQIHREKKRECLESCFPVEVTYSLNVLKKDHNFP